MPYRPAAATLTALVAVLAGLLACSSGTESAAPAAAGPPATPVKVVTVGTASLAHAADVAGTIEAVQSVEVRPETSGQVVRVAFDDGQDVRRGDVLVQLRDDAARADLDTAKSQLALAESDLQRVQGLVQREHGSQADLDRATATRDIAKAAVDKATDALRKTTIRAPFDGKAGRRMVNVGDWLDASHVVTRIEDLSTVAVDVDLPERLLADLDVGDPVHARVVAYDDPFDGTVTYVAPRVDATTRTVSVRAKLPNPDGKLRPGMSAQVAVVTSSQEAALVVPTQAVQTGANGASVYVAGDDGKAVLKPVQLGVREASDVEVTDGLQAGDKVIVEGLVKLQPGAAIQILDDAPKPADGVIGSEPARAEQKRVQP